MDMTRRPQKVLLTNPFTLDDRPNPNVGIDLVVTRHAGQEIKTGVTFPLGLAMLAGVLREKGHQVKCFDPIAEKVPASEIIAAAEWAEAIIIPYSPAHDADLREFFSRFSNKLRITGGGFSYYFGDQLFSPDFCEVILGPDPDFFIADILERGGAGEGIPSIGWWRGESFVRNPPPERELGLDSLPYPAYDLFPLQRYHDIIFFGQPTIWPLPSRGCPYQCIFCAQHFASRGRVRYRAPANFVGELEMLRRRHRIRNFVFFDEAFNLNRDFARRVCRLIIEKKLGIRWSCAARSDLIDEETARLMKEAGCIEMRLGLESANDEILEYLGKNVKVAEFRRGIEVLKKVGLTFSLQCIFGSPGETLETIQRTMDFIRWARPLFVSFNILTPLPGSQLFEQVKEGLEIEQLKTFDILHSEIQLGEFTVEELRREVRRAYRGYYLSPYFAGRLVLELARRPSCLGSFLGMIFRQGVYFRRSVLSRRKQ